MQINKHSPWSADPQSQPSRVQAPFDPPPLPAAPPLPVAAAAASDSASWIASRNASGGWAPAVGRHAGRGKKSWQCHPLHKPLWLTRLSNPSTRPTHIPDSTYCLLPLPSPALMMKCGTPVTRSLHSTAGTSVGAANNTATASCTHTRQHPTHSAFALRSSACTSCSSSASSSSPLQALASNLVCQLPLSLRLPYAASTHPTAEAASPSGKPSAHATSRSTAASPMLHPSS